MIIEPSIRFRNTGRQRTVFFKTQMVTPWDSKLRNDDDLFAAFDS